MLRIGTRAPEFTLPDQDGRDVSLSHLLRSGPLILYFYPADFTPGCTREACSIRDLHPAIRSAGMNVAGVSPQDAESHRAFRARYGLEFTLLSDPGKTVIRMYGVNGPFGLGVRRATFLIDPSRVIRDTVRADLRVSLHERFIRTGLALGRGRA